MADFVRFGRAVRALRRHRRLRQSDLARAARVSRQRLSRIERGLGGTCRIADMDRIGEALGARLTLRLDWNGEALDRLLDGQHARLVELLVLNLRHAGWDVATEVTFAIGGERGSIDVLGFHHPTAVLLVVEAKTVIPDVQSMLAALDRKVRLAGAIARQESWSAVAVGRLLAVTESRTSRRRVEALPETFRQQFPDRVARVRAWIARPDAADPIRGLWFVADRKAEARHRIALVGRPEPTGPPSPRQKVKA